MEFYFRSLKSLKKFLNLPAFENFRIFHFLSFFSFLKLFLKNVGPKLKFYNIKPLHYTPILISGKFQRCIIRNGRRRQILSVKFHVFEKNGTKVLKQVLTWILSQKTLFIWVKTVYTCQVDGLLWKTSKTWIFVSVLGKLFGFSSFWGGFSQAIWG